MELSLTLTIGNLDKVLAEVRAYPKDVEKIINNEFKAAGQNMVNDAKRLVPKYEGGRGGIASAISVKVENLSFTFGAYKDWAAFVEFGTKKFATSYVAALPPDWQAFANQFKGNGGGTFTQFFYAILEWVTVKGIAATHSVKTKKRLNNADNQQREREAAYAICLSILRNGIKAQPYLFPAFEKNKLELIRNLKQQLNAK